MSSHGAMIVIGSGPGIGSTTATTFATKGFKHIILMSRNADRLKQDAQEVKAASNAAQVETVPVDLGADESQINASFKKAKSILENWGVPVEVVLFNAIRVGQSKVMEFSSADFERDLKVGVVSLYTSLQWAIPELLQTAKDSTKKATFLATSGGLYRDPFPDFFSLSACKAAQFNLVHSMYKKYAGQGIHFAQIPVSGIVTKGDGAVTSAENIAETYWKLYQQGANGDLSIELEHPQYRIAMEKRS